MPGAVDIRTELGSVLVNAGGFERVFVANREPAAPF
jgi:hypothetical protein